MSGIFDPAIFDKAIFDIGVVGGAGDDSAPQRHPDIVVWVDEEEPLPTETPPTETVAPVVPNPRRGKRMRPMRPIRPINLSNPSNDDEEEAIMLLLAA